MTTDHIPPEYRVLEHVAQRLLGVPPRETLAALLDQPGFSWGELLEQGVRHRFLPALSHTLESDGLGKRAPKKVRDALNDLRYLARKRAAVFQQTSLALAGAVRREGLAFSLRKGLITQEMLYSPSYLRIFSDVDLLVAPADAARLERVLQAEGYTIGHFDHHNDRVGPLPREEAIRVRLNPDHLPRYTRKLDDNVVRYVEVDVATSLTWTNSGYNVPVEAALASAVPIESGPLAGLPRLDMEFLLIDTMLHLFREAYLEITIQQTGEDVGLLKFLDVALLWRRLAGSPAGTRRLAELVRRHGIEAPIAWVAAHTDGVLGTDIVSGLTLRSATGDDFLYSWRASGGAKGRWHGSMRERLATKDRRPLFEVA